MILKVLPLAVLLLLELSLANSQWYGGYDSGQYGQQYIVINPYGSGYEDAYSQYNSYPYNDPYYYSQPYNQYSSQPIVIIVNNERDMDCDMDDFLSLIFHEDKCGKEPVYVPYPVPVVVESHDRCECGCKKCECNCRCESQCECNKCRSKDDCQCKKKKERHDKKCKCNECQKHSCNCGGLYHRM